MATGLIKLVIFSPLHYQIGVSEELLFTQPIIDINLTVAPSMIGTDVIPLAYTSAPGVSEHYGACEK